MAWSAENATKAYLRTLKMGKRAEEPDVSEFISASAAGNNAQLMVEACGGIAGHTTLALVAAAHHTCGRVVCILPGLDKLRFSVKVLGSEAKFVEFVVGDAPMLLLYDYKGADFVLIDCNLEKHETVLGAAQLVAKSHAAVVMGYNASQKGSWWTGSRTHLLPIGDGLQVLRILGSLKTGGVTGRRNKWVVRVDQCTGEEHVFGITHPYGKELQP